MFNSCHHMDDLMGHLFGPAVIPGMGDNEGCGNTDLCFKLCSSSWFMNLLRPELQFCPGSLPLLCGCARQ